MNRQHTGSPTPRFSPSPPFKISTIIFQLFLFAYSTLKGGRFGTSIVPWRPVELRAVIVVATQNIADDIPLYPDQFAATLTALFRYNLFYNHLNLQPPR